MGKVSDSARRNGASLNLLNSQFGVADILGGLRTGLRIQVGGYYEKSSAVTLVASVERPGVVGVIGH